MNEQGVSSPGRIRVERIKGGTNPYKEDPENKKGCFTAKSISAILKELKVVRIGHETQLGTALWYSRFDRAFGRRIVFLPRQRHILH